MLPLGYKISSQREFSLSTACKPCIAPICSRDLYSTAGCRGRAERESFFRPLLAAGLKGRAPSLADSPLGPTGLRPQKPPLGYSQVSSCEYSRDQAMHFAVYSTDQALHFVVYSTDQVLHFVVYSTDQVLHFAVYSTDQALHFADNYSRNHSRRCHRRCQSRSRSMSFVFLALSSG